MLRCKIKLTRLYKKVSKAVRQTCVNSYVFIQTGYSCNSFFHFALFAVEWLFVRVNFSVSLASCFFFVEHFLTEFAGNSLLWAVTHMGSVMFLQTAERSENAYLVRKQGGHFPMKASEWLFKWLLVNGFLLRIIMDTFLYEFQSLFKW